MSASESLALLPAAELRRMIGRRDVSAVEVVEACLARVERLNPTLNAVVTLSDRAVDEARALDERAARREPLGLLHGLPVGIKDVTPTRGVRTTFGSKLYEDYVPDRDALVVRRLREAGAVVLGKTNTPEFTAGGNTFNEVFGHTRNPWDPALTAGGSTGGGAAGLATGMIALAEGTDLGGSLRMPASFCGVVGLRPSPGLVPTVPADYLWDVFSVTGPMARTAEDVALMLQAVAGPSPESPLAQPIAGRDFVGAVREGPGGSLRVAYAPDVAGIGIAPDLEDVCRRAALGLGDEAEVLDLNLSFARPAFLALRGYWMVATQIDRLSFLDRFGPNLRGNVESGLKVTTRQLGAAEEARARLWWKLSDVFRRFDVLLTPCMAVPPFPVEQNYPEVVAGRKMATYVDWFAPTFVLSLAGLPVASVPCGLDARGLPVGLQVVGPPRGEETVLAVAGRVADMHPIGLPEDASGPSSA